MPDAATIIDLLQASGLNVQVRLRMVDGILFEYTGVITADGQMVRGAGTTRHEQATDLARRFDVDILSDD